MKYIERDTQYTFKQTARQRPTPPHTHRVSLIDTHTDSASETQSLRHRHSTQTASATLTHTLTHMPSTGVRVLIVTWVALFKIRELFRVPFYRDDDHTVGDRVLLGYVIQGNSSNSVTAPHTPQKCLHV